MAYVTAAEVKQSSTAISSMSTLTDADIEFYADKISSIIDAKLALEYAVPFAQTPPVISSIAIDMTLCAILKQRIFTSNRIVDEGLVDWCGEALNLLKSIAAGRTEIMAHASLGGSRVERLHEHSVDGKISASPWIDDQDMLCL